MDSSVLSIPSHLVLNAWRTVKNVKQEQRVNCVGVELITGKESASVNVLNNSLLLKTPSIESVSVHQVRCSQNEMHQQSQQFSQMKTKNAWKN